MNHSRERGQKSFRLYLQIGNSTVKSRGLSRFSSFPLTCFITGCSYTFIRFLFHFSFSTGSTIPIAISFNRSLPFFPPPPPFFYNVTFFDPHTHTSPIISRPQLFGSVQVVSLVIPFSLKLHDSNHANFPDPEIRSRLADSLHTVASFLSFLHGLTSSLWIRAPRDTLIPNDLFSLPYLRDFGSLEIFLLDP